MPRKLGPEKHMDARKSRTLLFIRVHSPFPDGLVSYFPRDRRDSFCTFFVSPLRWKMLITPD